MDLVIVLQLVRKMSGKLTVENQSMLIIRSSSQRSDRDSCRKFKWRETVNMAMVDAFMKFYISFVYFYRMKSVNL